MVGTGDDAGPAQARIRASRILLRVGWLFLLLSLVGPASIEPQASGWIIAEPPVIFVLIAYLIAAVFNPWCLLAWVLVISFALTPVSVKLRPKGRLGRGLRLLHWCQLLPWLFLVFGAPTRSGLQRVHWSWGFYIFAFACTSTWLAVVLVPLRPPGTVDRYRGFDVITKDGDKTESS